MSAIPDPLSRYRDVPAVVAPDPQGRLLPGTDLRALPQVSGTLQHRVQQGDRLDQLAQAYYGEPLQWWHICDANPDVLSPLALVGAEPVTVTEFPLSAPGEPPPWADLLPALAALAGVQAVTVLDDVELLSVRAPGTPPDDPPQVRVRPVRAVQVTHNSVATAAATIADVIAASGFRLAGSALEHGRIGQPIVVPPPVAG
jgi:hypothetical protein